MNLLVNHSMHCTGAAGEVSCVELLRPDWATGPGGDAEPATNRQRD